MVRENGRCNDSVEEVDGIGVGSHKRKRRDSVSSLSRLIRSIRRSSHTHTRKHNLFFCMEPYIAQQLGVI